MWCEEVIKALNQYQLILGADMHDVLGGKEDEMSSVLYYLGASLSKGINVWLTPQPQR